LLLQVLQQKYEDGLNHLRSTGVVIEQYARELTPRAAKAPTGILKSAKFKPLPLQHRLTLRAIDIKLIKPANKKISWKFTVQQEEKLRRKEEACQETTQLVEWILKELEQNPPTPEFEKSEEDLKLFLGDYNEEKQEVENLKIHIGEISERIRELEQSIGLAKHIKDKVRNKEPAEQEEHVQEAVEKEEKKRRI